MLSSLTFSVVKELFLGNTQTLPKRPTEVRQMQRITDLSYSVWKSSTFACYVMLFEGKVS